MNPALVYPMFAMFILSALVLARMFATRTKAIKSGEVKISQFKVYTQEQGPAKMLQASRHFSNLFEVPVLFYAVCILGIIFSAGTVFVVLAWIYVLARVIHATIHLTSNKILLRMSAYAFGWVALASMWIVLLIHLA